MRQYTTATDTDTQKNAQDILISALRRCARKLKAREEKNRSGETAENAVGGGRRKRQRIIAVISSDGVNRRFIRINYTPREPKKIKCPRLEQMRKKIQDRKKLAAAEQDAAGQTNLQITVKGGVGRRFGIPAVVCPAITVCPPPPPAESVIVETKTASPKMDDVTVAQPATADWLQREWREGYADRMVWKTTSKSGKVRSYTLKVNTIRYRLLDCISKMLPKGPVITNTMLISASQAWNRDSFFSDKGGAPRGPLKSHVCELRSKLGMKISYVNNGIKVEQPED